MWVGGLQGYRLSRGEIGAHDTRIQVLTILLVITHWFTPLRTKSLRIHRFVQKVYSEKPRLHRTLETTTSFPQFARSASGQDERVESHEN